MAIGPGQTYLGAGKDQKLLLKIFVVYGRRVNVIHEQEELGQAVMDGAELSLAHFSGHLSIRKIWAGFLVDFVIVFRSDGAEDL